MQVLQKSKLVNTEGREGARGLRGREVSADTELTSRRVCDVLDEAEIFKLSLGRLRGKGQSASA